ncbi:hypothetical protein BDY19DRAFT_894235 [Irpex rosettiformis]|uniref:Uncharacterized protein n=1 Tax=Irpex rosettiformis TaxID=378272 RepID=A0ACB8TXM6_9APHY|nr:hypothetical protein BDY19DRAFT_894235 [Irpex rosettiformis]
MASKSKPAPYTYERDDRSVTPPPRRSPSPSYLKLADEPPQSLHSTEGQRKLLILDLNGTLVHRSALHRPKHRGAPQSASALDKNGRPLPKLRPVHPRPYMTAFRSYLFAPETRAWLDVMVWSSAQPHSVGDMVEKCFASDKEKLLAVWARDTLGLPKDHYCTNASSSDESPRRPRPHPDTVHSAFTTLLLDDSPRKAELQPYNHVCIPEYSGEMRANDLEVLRTEKILADSNQDVTDTSPEFDDFSAEAPAKSEDPTLQQALLEAQSEHENKAYDETLLAVIGVLDEIKSQRNVAAWIRSGGLLRTYGTSRSSANVTVDTVISMWFERPETVQSWVEKGKKALKALRIPVEHGIDH